MQTLLAPATTHLLEAAALLAAGDLVAFPTETVYGLGADARSRAAVEKIYAAKGRPSGNPVIVHLADPADAPTCVTTWPPLAEKLAQLFWPGPLTLILPRSPLLTDAVSAGRSTVALRCPNHPVAEALLRTCGFPIAAPSANRSGFTSPTTAQHVYAELAGRIPLILDGGPSTIGLESTVLDLTSKTPTILRPGAVTREMLQSAIGPVLTFHQSLVPSTSAISPGQHHRHYAPTTPAFSISRIDWSAHEEKIRTRSDKIILITYDPAIALPAPHEVLLLPPTAEKYAAALYASLRQADDLTASCILVLLPDNLEGMWAAVVDRLHRATIPFSIT